MLLTASSRSCLASEYVIHRDGRPAGSFVARWFGEGIDVDLAGRQRRDFVREGWFGGAFTLFSGSGEPLARARRRHLLTTAWDLELSRTDARLESAGWFNTRFHVMSEERVLASVDRDGLLSRGFVVEAFDGLSFDDALFAGLLYRTIRRRRAASSSTP